MRRLTAFTLTEIMIALAIVGVIVAITVPAAITRYQNNSMLTMIKKNYVELQEALTVLQTEKYLKSDLFNSTLAQDSATFMKQYFKYTKNCGTSATNGCFASSYRSLSGSSEDFTACDNANANSLLLKSGSAICIIKANKASETPAKVYVDVNGAENPNIGGRDMFTFNIYKDYRIDETDSLLESDRKNINKTCTTSTVGAGCFSTLLGNDWNMDY